VGIDPLDLERALGRSPEHSVMSDGRLVVQSNNEGVPFVLASPDAGISKDILRLATELVNAGRVTATAGRTWPPMSDPRPIGVFDSGVGGLTVLREILRRTPAESTLVPRRQRSRTLRRSRGRGGPGVLDRVARPARRTGT
jgi:hypothetical protein